MIRPKAAANNGWYFQKVFGDGEFIAAGQLLIPPKGSKDNTYVRLSFVVSD
jgi:centromere protein C